MQNCTIYIVDKLSAITMNINDSEFKKQSSAREIRIDKKDLSNQHVIEVNPDIGIHHI